jgi:hypothetical protein
MIERVLRENVDAQTRRLELFLQVLDRMIPEILSTDQGSVRKTLLTASMMRVRQAGRAVHLLSGEGLVEEILAIGRTLVEVTVNAVYLEFAPDAEVDQYLHFHPETSYKPMSLQPRRNAGMLGKLGGLVLRNLPRRTNDQADPSWTRRTLMERAQICDTASEVPVMVPLLTRCYAKGHAAVHGTIGALSSFIAAMQAMEPPRREDRFGDLTEALFVVTLCLLTVCVYLNDIYQLGMEEAIDQAATADSSSRASLEGE